MLRRGLLAAVTAAPPAGQPPNTYAGLTFWMSGDDSVVYTRLSPPSGANSVTTANDAILSRINSAGAISRSLSNQSTPDSMTLVRYKNPLGGLSSKGIRFVRGDLDTEPYLAGLGVYTKPSGLNNASTPTAIGSLWSASTKVAICAVKVNDADTEQTTAWLHTYLIGDADIGYAGLMAYRDGADTVFMAYSFSGGAPVTAVVSHPLGSWVTVAMKHQGGQLRVRVNDGAWTSTACGNTDVMTNHAIVLGYMRDVMDFEIAELATYNANRSDAEILEVQRWMGSRVGLSF